MSQNHMNPTAIARAKEAIAAGKKLQTADEPTVADPKPAKGAKATKPATPKAAAKPAAKGVPAAKPQPTKAELKATEKAAKEAAAAKEKANKEKAAEKARKAKEAADAKKQRDAEKATTKAENAAAYKARIEQQKLDTANRHRHEKLYNSFRARVKYMLYMDNPALGGLEGRENLGWALKHRNSTGDIYTVERIQDKVHVNMVPKGGELTQVATCKPIEADVLKAMEKWTA